MHIEIVKQLVKEAGKQALCLAGTFRSHTKEDSSPVTEADYAIQHFLENRLKSLFPTYCFISEEKNNDFSALREDDYAWVVDPIDGTDAFREGLPVWGIAVGLVHQFKPVMGLFYMPAADMLFYRDEQGVAYSNGRLIVRPEHHESKTAYVTSGFHKRFDTTYKGKLRSLGSTVAHLCFLATGAGHAAIIRGFPWDVVAGYAVLEAMGGALFTLDKQPFDFAEMIKSGGRIPYLIASPTKEFPEFGNHLIPR